MLLLSSQKRWTLPYFELNSWHEWQVVSPVNQVVRVRLGINTTVLCCVFDNSELQIPVVQRVYLLENHSPGWAILPEGRWVSRTELAGIDLLLPKHRVILEAWFTEVEGSAPSLLRRPWARVGWFEQAVAWIQSQSSSLGLTVRGPVVQLRTWERSCILRVSTTVGKLYFKAVPTLFAHEIRLTQVLAESYPVQVPQILATHPEQHWMLMQDFGGQPLSQVLDLALWQSALRQFAQMQIDWAEGIHRLIDLGCPERRLDQLAGQIDSLLADLPTMPGLSPEEIAQLQGLAPQLQGLCAKLSGYRIPHTLEHGDFHAQNIILTDQGALYFDWSDCAIAHPFFSLSLFFRSIEQEGWFPNISQVRSRLETAYLEPWRVYEPMNRLLEAFELAQILEILHHAITYHQILLPTIEDKSKWAAIAPFHLKTLLRHLPLLKGSK